MASGQLGVLDLVAVTGALLYTVPAAKTATFNIRFVNRNAATVKVRAAVTTAASFGAIAAGEWFEYDAQLLGTNTQGNVLEDQGLVADTGKKIWVYSDTSNVNAQAWGFEE